MRKTSIPSVQEKVHMPYPESDPQLSSTEQRSIGTSQIRQPFQSLINDTVNQSNYVEPPISSASTIQSSTTFPDIPQQLFSVPMTHSDLSYSAPNTQAANESFNPGNFQESTTTSVLTNASNFVPVMTSMPPAYTEKNRMLILFIFRVEYSNKYKN